MNSAPDGLPLPTRLRTRARFLLLLVLAASTLAVFNGVLGGKLITNNFYLFAYEPWAHHLEPDMGFYNYMLSDDADVMSVSFPTTQSLREGYFPYWNKYWQLGLPEFRLDSGWFYPLRIFWVLFGVPIGMTVEVLVRFLLGGIFTYLLLELMGVAPLIALASALGYMFGSNSIGDYMFGFGPIGLALPIAVYCIERVIRFQRTRDVVFLTLAWMYLNTHIMIHANALASGWLALYMIIRILFESRKALLVRHLVLSAGFAVALLMFALLPTLEFYLHDFNTSYRAGRGLEQSPPGALLTLFFNSFFGIPLLEKQRYLYGSFTGSAVFVGFLCGICALTVAPVRLVLQRDKHIISAALVTLLLALGIYEFPFERFERFFQFIPMLEYTSPLYQKPIFQFFVMMCGALGADFLWNLSQQRRGVKIFSVCLLAAGFCFATWSFLHYYWRQGPSVMLWKYFTILSVAHFAMVLIVLVLAFTNKHGASGYARICRPLLACLLVCLVVFESVKNTDKWIPYSKLKHWYPNTRTTDYLNEHLGDSRIISLDRFAVPGLLYGYGYPIAAGRSLPRQEYLELLRLAAPGVYRDHPTQSFFQLSDTDLASPIWDLANVNFFLGGVDTDSKYLHEKYGDKIKVHRFIDGVVIERTSPSLPYVAAPHAVTSNSIETTRALIQSGLDVRRSIIITDPRFPSAPRPSCAPDSVRVREFRGFDRDTFRAVIENDCPAYFMVSTFYDRGWQAFIDGSEAAVYRAYGFLPVIQIESPGRHQIEFRYTPPGLHTGTWVSLIALVLAAVSLGYLGIMRKAGVGDNHHTRT